MSSVPASFLRPALGRIELGFPQRRRALMNVVLLTVVVGALYMLLATVFLLATYRQFVLAHGYPRPDLLPGALASDRFGLQWFVLAFAASHFASGALLLWSMKNIVDALKRFVHLYVAGLFVLLDLIVLIVLLVVSFFFCNNALSGGSLCNDPARYCLAFNGTARCPPLAPNATALDPAQLVPNPAFSALGLWSLVFLGLDLVALVLNSVAAVTVRAFLNQTLGQGYVRF